MARDDDLVEVRGELASELAGLANALTGHGGGLVEATLVDLTCEWRSLRDLPSHRRWARDRLARRSLRHPSDELVLLPDGAGTSAEVDAARALAVVRSLPPLPRAALVLTLVDDRDEGAVARALGTSTGTVRAALAEAQALVAERLPDPPADRPPTPVAPQAPAGHTPVDAAAGPHPDDFAPPWRRTTP